MDIVGYLGVDDAHREDIYNYIVDGSNRALMIVLCNNMISQLDLLAEWYHTGEGYNSVDEFDSAFGEFIEKKLGNIGADGGIVSLKNLSALPLNDDNLAWAEMHQKHPERN